MTQDTTEIISELFDVRAFTRRTIDGVIERVPLEHIELAHNPRRAISPEGIDRLAAMLCRTGQLVPAIGRRVSEEQVMLYAGQRRLMAARRSHELAGTGGQEDLQPLGSLIVLLLDHEPTDAEIRRIQAQENQREDLTMADQQEQFRDCWEDRAGAREQDRMLAVCADLGISPTKAHNLRRQLTLPEPIRQRVASRPSGAQISVTLANALADMHEISAQLTGAVAERITSPDLHDRALRDLGAFVHRTCVEDERVYAVRIDDGALLDGHQQIERARGHLNSDSVSQVASIFDCKLEEVEKELDALCARAKQRTLQVRVDANLRDRAANGRYAYVFARGEDFADGMWVVDPAFMLAVVHEQLGASENRDATEEAFFGAAKLQDEDMVEAAKEETKRKAQERDRMIAAANSNLGLGQDIAAGLLAPTGDQLKALRTIVCHLVAQHHPEVIAYGAGWTDRERQQPVGDTGRYEPRQLNAILDAELERALQDPEPLRGIGHLLARFAAAFVLDPDGVTKTKALGTERIARKLREALPGGDNPLRDAVWQFMRPMLSPHLIERNRDDFVNDEHNTSTVDLHAHRADSNLDTVDLGDRTADKDA